MSDKHAIRIREMNSGEFFVEVGCQRFFFLTRKALVSELEEYLTVRKLAEQKYKRWLEFGDDAYSQETPPPAAPVCETVYEPRLQDQAEEAREETRKGTS